MRQYHSGRTLSGTTLLFGLLLCGFCLGCGEKKDPTQKKTFKVTGNLTVDDNVPETPLQLACYPKDRTPEPGEILPSCNSTLDGTFQFITYKEGDGVPEGDYVITVTWKDYNPITRTYGKVDKLNGRYSDPKTTTIEFTVDNASVDLGTIELKTK